MNRGFDRAEYETRTARAQVLLEGPGPRALLLCYRQRRWYLEGVYE